MPTKLKTAPVTFTSRYHRKTYLIGDEAKVGLSGSALSVTSGYRRIEFISGTFTTDDAETIDWLCDHRDFNVEIFRLDQPGAFIPTDDSTKVVGEVATTKSVAGARSRGPVADNVVEAD